MWYNKEVKLRVSSASNWDLVDKAQWKQKAYINVFENSHFYAELHRLKWLTKWKFATVTVLQR